MTRYFVVNDDTGFREEFFNLTSAKKAMIKNNAICFKEKIYSNGDSVYCGEIHLKASNKTFIANSPKNMSKSNY